MFKLILIILLIILIVFFLIQNILISFHKIYVFPETIKYATSHSDKRYLDRYSTKGKLSELSPGNLFFTEKKWSTKNNNYILFKERYYIIEPGYYYYLHGDLTINNDNDIFILNSKINVLK